MKEVDELKSLIDEFKSIDLENPNDYNESDYELEMSKLNWDDISKKNGGDRNNMEAKIIPINASMLNDILKSDERVLV